MSEIHSPTIHPTAIIHPKAELGAGTRVGAYAVIGPDVILGEACEVRPHAVIDGFVRMGSHNQIGYGAIIGAEPQDTRWNGGKSYVEIGSHNIFREYVTIHRGTELESSTKIGNHNLLMAGSHVAHNCTIGDRVTLVNNVLLAGRVTVEDGAFLGGAAAVHQYVRIGRLAMVRGLTRLGQDVPPFTMAVATNTVCGLNRVGLKRQNISLQTRRLLLEVYDTFYHIGLNRTQAMQQILLREDWQANDLVRHFCQFAASTKRGLCRAVRATRDSSLMQEEL